MNIKRDYPDFASIEKHIARARAERSVAVSHMVVELLESIGRGLKSLSATMGKGLAAERDRRAIEADSFLKRSVPKY
jgi:hypothetical protein